MTSDKGNREWLNDCEPLKKVNPNNPFTVPDGYFNELNERIVSVIRLDNLKQNAQQDFTVPENYFNELGGQIMSRINIEQALNQPTGFTVPDNYFEQLTAQIKSRVRVEEAIAGVEGTMTVPEGYFDRLNKKILNKTVNQDIVKRKTIMRRIYNSPVFKYATAACFVAVIGAGVFFKPWADTSTKHRTSYLHQELSTLSDQELQSYLKLYADANEAQHIIGANGLKVNDAKIQSDLDIYIDTE